MVKVNVYLFSCVFKNPGKKNVLSSGLRFFIYTTCFDRTTVDLVNLPLFCSETEKIIPIEVTSLIV